MVTDTVAGYNRQLVQRWKKRRRRIDQLLKQYQKDTLADPMGEVRYCILTPQVDFQRAQAALAQLNSDSALHNRDKVVAVLRQQGVRFPNVKADRIMATVGRQRELKRLLLVKDDYRLRELLHGNFPGLGLKEATHFLRNLGRADRMAMLDVWVFRGMEKAGLIATVPKAVWPALYYRMEGVYLKWADDLSIPPKHLDLLLHREGESLGDVR